jgi:4-hydroxy-tetrahydrodipicolinate synthase
MTKPLPLRGCYTALITPFTAQDTLDIAAYEAFISWQIEQGVHGIVPCGTTGESPTLSHEEHKQLIDVAVKITAGRVGVMAGTGSNCTSTAVEFARHAEKAGASSMLVVAPYYNKPTQEGIFQHYKKIAEASSLPLIVYNIPGRSGVNIADTTLARLADACPTIAGVKDATGDLARVASLKHLLGERLVQFSGEDITAVGFNAMGGQGVISVTSNIAPHAVAEVQNLTLAGKYSEATTLQQTLVPWHQNLFAESNPTPVKYVASLMGKCRADVRLPLVKPSDATQQLLQSLMHETKLKAA